ncbi:hypothetical protein LINPERPRIM_LOCUS20026 [Linum perenne]
MSTRCFILFQLVLVCRNVGVMPSLRFGDTFCPSKSSVSSENPTFASVRSQILRTEPLPSINVVFSMDIQEEQELGIHGDISSSITPSVPAVATTSSSQVLATGPSGYKKTGKRSICTNCGLIGHSIEKCYKPIGYPPGYRQKGKAASINIVAADEMAPNSLTERPGGVMILKSSIKPFSLLSISKVLWERLLLGLFVLLQAR